jgi:hypothetical protein
MSGSWTFYFEARWHSNRTALRFEPNVTNITPGGSSFGTIKAARAGILAAHMEL